MMDTVRSFLRGILDVGMAVIPVSVVLGVISVSYTHLRAHET